MAAGVFSAAKQSFKVAAEPTNRAAKRKAPNLDPVTFPFDAAEHGLSSYFLVLV
jgi:hypothetical protein